MAHFDKDRLDQKEQTFYCHFECFRTLIADDGLLYINEPDFATLGQVAAERAGDEEDE